jgi:hypothetical protein
MNARRITVRSLAAAALGALLLVAGLLSDPGRAWFAYLAAWLFATTVCMGALVLLMTGHAAKASWMVVTRRPTEAIVGALPLCMLLFIPLCFGLRHVYPWVEPSPGLAAHVQRAIEHKRHYLNPPFFIFRSLVYLLVFVVIGSLLRGWSTECDDRPSLRLVRRMRALSGGALPLVALVFTWASFDWTMSLEPEWSSTIFGLYQFAGGFIGAIALVAIVADVAHLRGGAGPGLSPDHAQALGRLLFAMVVFWAYMAFSQLLIYWIGDIPDEVSYYGLRTRGSWSAINYLLVLGHFVGPFFALLNRHWKRHPGYLAAVGGWMLAMHFVDVYWMVLPVHDRSGVRPHWLDAAALLFVGGLFCAFIVRRYAAAPPMPRHVPELARGIRYEAAV